MSDITVTEVVVNILNGNLDEGRERIYDALKRRGQISRQIEAATAIGTLNTGDKVELHGLRPQYLNGLTGVVLNKRQTRITVKLDNPELAGKFAYGGTVTAPAACLKAVPA